MRYPAGQKEEARKQILALAASRAKRDGFSATGIDSLAQTAGVTSGAVYSQFGSKSKLFAELVESELARSRAMFVNKSRDEVLEGLRWYLSLSHVNDPGSGCVMPALSVEVGRAETEVRQMYERNLLEIQRAAGALLGDDALAWCLIAQAVGALVVSRAMDSEKTREALLNAVLSNAERAMEDSATSG